MLQIVVVKDGSDTRPLSVGDGEDTKVFLSVNAPFVAALHRAPLLTRDGKMQAHYEAAVW